MSNLRRDLYGLFIGDRLAYWLWRYRFWRYLRDGSRGKHPGEFPVLHVGHFEVGLREERRP